MTKKIKKLTEVEPGEKQKLEPTDDYVHPDLEKHQLTPEKKAQVKELGDKIAALEKQLELLKQQHEQAWQEKKDAENEKKNVDNIDEQLLKAASIIKRDCSIALKSMQVTNAFVFRGIKGAQPNIFVGKPRDDRRSKDTNNDIQTGFDEMLSESGFKALRSNSIFCSGNYSQADNYGKVYLIFPKDGFNFTWSPMFSDLFSDLLSDLRHNGIDSLYRSKEYNDAKKQFNASIQSDIYMFNEFTEFIVQFDSKKPDTFEEFLADTDNQSQSDEIKALAANVYNNFDIVIKLAQACISVLKAIIAAAFPHDIEDEYIPTAFLTKLIRLYKKLDYIKFVDVFRYPLRYSSATNNQSLLNNTLIKNINEFLKEANSPILTPDEVIFDKLKFNHTDFTAAITSQNEICIAGEYYAIRYESNDYDLLDVLREIFDFSTY